MKKILFLLLILSTGCQKEEYNQDIVSPIKKEHYVTFKVTGLSTDVQKQVTILCAGTLLDTVIIGNFTYKLKVTQRIMYAEMYVKSAVPINDALMLEGNGQEIYKRSSCDWYQNEIKYLFEFEGY